MSDKRSVLVSYLHPGDVGHNFMDSLWNLHEYDRSHEQYLHMRFPVQSGPSLDKSRNAQARTFLEQSDCQWLWIIDSDMGFYPNTLSKLMRVASRSKPVVAGLCPGLAGDVSDDRGGWKYDFTFCAYQFDNDANMWKSMGSPPANKLVEVDGVGTGCVLIHRSVLEELDNPFGFHYYGTTAEERYGEDLSFCYKVKNVLHRKIYVHTGVRLTHRKTIYLTD